MNPLSPEEFQQMLDGYQSQGLGNGGAVTAPPSTLPNATPLSALGLMFATSSQADVAILEDALSFVSSDVERGNGYIFGPDGQPVVDYWFGVMLAARREYGDAAKEVMRSWSQTSPRYTDDGFEHAWKQFDPNHKKPITIGSLFMLAKSKGWLGKAPAPSAPSATNRGNFHLLDRNAIMAIQPIQWRVKRLLPTTGIAAIFGPSGSGKSFLAKDMAVRIALGQDWFGHRTKACPVTYVMLEGEAGLCNRVTAWEAHNGTTIPSNFKALAQPFQLADPDHVAELGALLPAGGLVIIDTLNRSAPGLDENSSQDMGRILAGMKRLQEITGGLVLVVHHTGKDASKGLRGHSSLHAALDGAIEVERSANSRFWSAAKVKDGEDGKQVAFQLHRVVLGKDADGDEISSCAVGPDTGAVFRKPEPSGKSQRSAISTIRRSLSLSPDTGHAGCNPQIQCLKVEDAVSEVAATLTAVETNKRRNRARTLVRGLTEGGYLQSGIDASGEAWLWL
ncbi:MAG: AAA family ATPase [Sphingomonadales bacterium]|jgi:energy-coupling factor transporter ATP-binding protein EcfA2